LRNILRNIILIILAISVIGFAGAQKELRSPPGTLDGINPSLSFSTLSVADTLFYGTQLSIGWSAFDSAFSERPIKVGYNFVSQPGVDYLIDSVSNGGQFDWIVPSEINGVIKIYVEAVDLFGNSTRQYSAPQTIIGINPGPLWYVALNGNDENCNGTEDFPYATIQQAFSKAESGDTVFVKPGHYFGPFDDFEKGLLIQSLGNPSEVVLQDTASNRAIVTLNGNTTIQGFYIIGKGAGSLSIGIQTEKDFSRIINNHIDSCYIGIVSGGYAQPEIGNNLITACGTAISGSDRTVLTVNNNTIVANQRGIEVNNGITFHCLNNIVDNNSGGGGLVVNGEVNRTIKFNNFWANLPENFTGIPNLTGTDCNISADPLFVDAVKGNYRLTPLSSSINAGDPTSHFDQEPEPNGDRINLGFYGGTKLAEIAALKFTSDILTTISEDSLYQQESGILPDNNVTFTFRALVKPAWLTLGTNGLLSGIPHNQNVGISLVNLAVADNYTRTDTLRYSLEVMNTPPVFTSQPNTTTLEDEQYSYDAQTSDDNEGPVKYSLLQPDWLSIDSLKGLVSGTPTNDLVGLHSVVIQCDDGHGGIVQQQYTLMVINVNDPPVLISSIDTCYNEDEILVIPHANLMEKINDVDDPDSVLTITISKSSGVGFYQFDQTANAHKFWADKDVNGKGNFSISIADPHGVNINKSFSVEIIPVNDAPELFAIADTTTMQDSLFILPLQSVWRDVDNSAGEMSWTASAILSEVYFNSAFDSLFIQPQESFVGWDTVMLRIADPEDLFDQDTFRIYFEDNIPPTFITGIFQNPVASEHLDIYFFPDEPIDSVYAVTVANTPAAVKIISAIQPSPYHTHYRIKQSNIHNVSITATDLAQNIGTTEYDFSSTFVSKQIVTRAFSPDSIVFLLLPAKAFNDDAFLLCLPNARDSVNTRNETKMTLGKSVSNEEILDYSFISTQHILAKMAKLEFILTDEIKAKAQPQPGIFVWENECWKYLKTYTDTQQKCYWIYTKNLGRYSLQYNAPEPAVLVPTKLSLAQNYPNPFNSITTIGFALPEMSSTNFAANTNLVIYDILGREVVRLINQKLPPGTYTVIWNGRNTHGIPVASGVYLYNLIYGHHNKTHKMVLVK